MSEEAQEGGWSGMKKTIIGIGGTAVTAVGVWVSTQVNTILGIEDEEAGTEQVAPVEQSNNQNVNVAGPEITINVPEQKSAGTNTVIKETVREVPVQAAPAPAPVEEKKETPAERMARLKKQKEEQNAGK